MKQYGTRKRHISKKRSAKKHSTTRRRSGGSNSNNNSDYMTVGQFKKFLEDNHIPDNMTMCYNEFGAARHISSISIDKMYGKKYLFFED